MYAGDLSIVLPVDNARRLQHDTRLAFVFIGGGVGRDVIVRYVEQHPPPNLSLLPYQPLARLPLSLAALPVVAMGDAMVGIVHPSKIYSALAAGRPSSHAAVTSPSCCESTISVGMSNTATSRGGRCAHPRGGCSAELTARARAR